MSKFLYLVSAHEFVPSHKTLIPLFIFRTREIAERYAAKLGESYTISEILDLTDIKD